MMAVLALVNVAQAAQKVITTAGPMTQIALGDHLSCQVQMAGDASQAFFVAAGKPPACVTYLQLNQSGGLLFGPDVGAGGVLPTADYTPVSQMLSGSGAASDPFVVTTTVNAIAGAGPAVAQLTEVDSYVVGQDRYDSKITVRNPSTSASIIGRLYHAGDCKLVSDSGYGSLGAAGAPQCAVNPNNTPAGRILSFIPVIAPGSSYVEGFANGGFGTMWSDITTTGTAYPNTVDALNNVDNALGISWPYSVPASQARTFEFQTRVSPNPTVMPSSSSPLIACSDSGQFPVQVRAPNGGGTLNLISDGAPQPAITPNSSGTATITLAQGGHAVEYWASDALGTQESPHHFQSVSVPCPPVIPPTGPPSASAPSLSAVGTSGGAFVATVTPNGLPTTAHFEYGLDAKYRAPGLTGPAYDTSTPDQQVGSDLTPHAVSAAVTGLVPNALYHVRLVASNGNGSTNGPDQAFVTRADPKPPPIPTIGKTFNASPVSGLVFVKLPGRHTAVDPITKGVGFIPLTEVRALPPGTQVDARQGTINLTAAAASVQHIGKIQSAKLAGASFKISSQTRSGLRKGLTTLQLREGDFAGAPTFSSCPRAGADSSRAIDPFAPLARPAASSRILQTLRASGRGRFQTRGRYSAGTVRGTVWDTVDRCDGTLTAVRRGTVQVYDYARRKTILVHAGHSYLARATKGKRK